MMTTIERPLETPLHIGPVKIPRTDNEFQERSGVFEQHYAEFVSLKIYGIGSVGSQFIESNSAFTYGGEPVVWADYEPEPNYVSLGWRSAPGISSGTVLSVYDGATRSWKDVLKTKETPRGQPAPSVFPEVEHRWETWRGVARIFEAHFAGFTPALEPALDAGHAVQSKDTRERLESIQKALGLSMSRLADLLDISRATLYTWLDQNQDIKLKNASREALERLEYRAELWVSLCEYAPGTLLRSREVEGKTLEAWLLDAVATDKQLHRVMLEIARRVEQRERKIALAPAHPAHPVSDDLRSID